MLSLFFSLAFAGKLIYIDDYNLTTELDKNEYNLVFLTSKTYRDGNSVPKTMNTIAHRASEPNIGLCLYDSCKNKKLTQKHPVVDNSVLLLFHRSTFIVQYFGNYTFQAITQFMKEINNNQTVYYPQTEFEIFKFQREKTPANIVLTNHYYIQYAEQIAHNYTQLLHVAVVTDKKLIEKLHLPHISFSKPNEFFTKDFQIDVSVAELAELAQPIFNIVENPNLIGKLSIGALYDKNSKWHLHKVISVFNQTKIDTDEELKHMQFLVPIPVRYTAIDFFDGYKFIKQYGIYGFNHPVFFICANTVSSGQIYQSYTDKAELIAAWLFRMLTGKEKVIHSENDGPIQKLSAYDFQKKVMDPSYDVILYVASPSMEHYKEGKKKAEMLYDILYNCKYVNIYEYNPLTEHVSGLQLPRNNFPQFSIWPAEAEKGGKTFDANHNFNLIFETLVQFMKSPINSKQMKEIKEKMAKYKEF